MKSTVKMIVLLITVVTLLSAIPVSASAAQIQDDVVSPMWDNASSVTATMTFEDGVGYATSDVIGKIGATHVKISGYIYRWNGLGWVYVTEDRIEFDTRKGSLTVEFTPVANTLYRVDFVVLVTRNGTEERICKNTESTYTPEG